MLGLRREQGRDGYREVVEEIITALSRIRWLFVIARNSSLTYKGQAIDVKQVERKLSVRSMSSKGQFRKASGGVSVGVARADFVIATQVPFAQRKRYGRLRC